MKCLFPVIFTAALVFFSCNQPTSTPSTIIQPDPLDILAQDSSVRPQDNFYLFANGTWLKKTEIPASQSSWGAFSTLQDSSLSRLNRILDSLSGLSGSTKGSIAQQTGDFYISAMDSAGIEKKGFLPVKSELDSIAAIKNKSEIYREIAKEYAINHAPFFSFYVTADDRNSLVNIAHFDQGGLGLPK